jgi:hypothetical protein
LQNNVIEIGLETPKQPEGKKLVVNEIGVTFLGDEVLFKKAMPPIV